MIFLPVKRQVFTGRPWPPLYPCSWNSSFEEYVKFLHRASVIKVHAKICRPRAALSGWQHSSSCRCQRRGYCAYSSFQIPERGQSLYFLTPYISLHSLLIHVLSRLTKKRNKKWRGGFHLICTICSVTFLWCCYMKWFMYIWFLGRLHHEMAACTLKQCQTNIANDLRAMCDWKQSVQEANNREGHLDVKFLEARYSKGLKKVEEFRESKHRYVESDNLHVAQPETLKFLQSNQGGQPFLSWNLC